MHLALALVLLIFAVGVAALDRARGPRGFFYYFNPLHPGTWTAAALGGACVALML